MGHIMDMGNPGQSEPFSEVAAIIANGVDDVSNRAVESLQDVPDEGAVPMGTRTDPQRFEILVS